MIRFIGDVHGHWNKYFEICANSDKTIQVGDMGMGFGQLTAEYFNHHMDRISGEHFFIRGNHDSPDECRRTSYWIPDGDIIDGIMYIGGASSIDKFYRTPGVDWWADEELSYDELYRIAEKYAKAKPDILVTHECPEFLATHVMIPLVKGNTNFPSKTRIVLDEMYAVHRPKIHIFGHWHHNLDYLDAKTGTRFICLNELSSIEIDTENI